MECKNMEDSDNLIFLHMSLEEKEKEMPVKLSDFKHYIDKADKR